jgi:metal-dependent amidase/aminoacylase/carboxypeptidase family protein
MSFAIAGGGSSSVAPTCYCGPGFSSPALRLHTLAAQISCQPCASADLLSPHKVAANEFIDEMMAPLKELSMRIHANPELNFEEHYAHSQITDFLEQHGLRVERGYAGFETAFLATIDLGEAGSMDGPTIVICAEYDALPKIGHACGHNLITEAAVAAALGVHGAIKSRGTFHGRLLLMGTPAEEGGGGKVELIRKGCFEEVDLAMMVRR